MLLNILIIFFLIGMAYWWSVQGFFSGLLHFVVVVTAGALALSLWEPLAVYLLLERVPLYAWTVALLGPFILLLLILRNAMDILVPQNLGFMPLVDMIGGGFFGVLAGILAAGLFVVGAQTLPTGTSLMGYQPLVVDADGSVKMDPARGLWVPVDRWTAGFYSGLSGGAFSAGNPMSELLPEMAKTQAMFRIRSDPNASIVATPDAVKVTGLYLANTPLANLDPGVEAVLGPLAKSQNRQMVIIDTLWVTDTGTFDQDSTLRLAPSQVRLASHDVATGDVVLTAPLGVATNTLGQRTRAFIGFANDAASVYGINQENRLGFVFFIPVGHDIDYLLLRRLRLSVQSDAPIADRQLVYQALGQAAVQDTADSGDSGDDGTATPDNGIGDGDGRPGTVEGIALEVTNQLPRPYSRNMASAMDDEEGVLSGSQLVRKSTSRISPNNKVDTVYAPGHQRIIRIQVEREKARSLFGSVHSSALALQPIYLQDSTGNQWTPFGYALDLGGDMELNFVNRTVGLRSGRDLPTPKMQAGHKLYLYFAVPVGTTIESYNVGNSFSQPVNRTITAD